ncbi:3-phenylpropionate/cinnamic acid dioxygenase ferredoxin subunit [Anatilimnocola aggregata]|uniref:3-phenylpropionate/cinnamic acid dioxygenase ferredoxin subunit n=1 Tax=Anatilimnocola aggregata TaxID=2528021 RepID=A0A517Y9K9_9BACT|nr:non-heme iron oxygenase ferredoxin subunit [Anatilimnocola aggregata]QDU26919.1 3-phenylpropionate/cinnamic acid dioxygenase ferredoxin subunit [Anatilimnocola aggregata]
MPEFVKTVPVAEIADPGRTLLEVGDRVVVLIHIGGKFFCIDDVCTHDGGPLSDGELDDHTIACPRHGAKFDICNGKALTMPATEDTAAHQTEVRDGWVWVKLREE